MTKEQTQETLIIDLVSLLRFIRNSLVFIIVGTFLGATAGYLVYKSTPPVYKVVAYINFIGAKGAINNKDGSSTERPLVDAKSAKLILTESLKQVVHKKQRSIKDFNIFAPQNNTYPITFSVLVHNPHDGIEIIKETIISANNSPLVKELVTTYVKTLSQIKSKYEKFYKDALKYYNNSGVNTKHAYLNIMYDLSEKITDLDIEIRTTEGFKLITPPEIDNNGDPVAPFLPFYLLTGAILGGVLAMPVAKIFIKLGKNKKAL